MHQQESVKSNWGLLLVILMCDSFSHPLFLLLLREGTPLLWVCAVLPSVLGGQVDENY